MARSEPDIQFTALYRNRQTLFKNICFLIHDPIYLDSFGDEYNYTEYDSCHHIASFLAIFFPSLSKTTQGDNMNQITYF